ncbi:MAG: hypothetical protein AAGG48_22885 [Planctomycetota bacterium]
MQRRFWISQQTIGISPFRQRLVPSCGKTGLLNGLLVALAECAGYGCDTHFLIDDRFAL